MPKSAQNNEAARTDSVEVQPSRGDPTTDGDETDLPTCFVIQPFDKGKFDKRYRDAFDPALREADLRAYRVDEDPAPDIPIEAIEDGIRRAAMVLADVTTNNPNVWYELGYAFALGKPVIMVCCEEDRDGRLPFDIQHRKVIHYQSESESDFVTLREQIAERAKALRERAVEKQVQAADPVARQDGLAQREIHVLGVVARATTVPGSKESVGQLSLDAGRGGFTKLAVGLAFRELIERGFVLVEEVEDDRENYSYDAAHVTQEGWNWIRQHEHLFIPSPPPADLDDFEDDIPF